MQRGKLIDTIREFAATQINWNINRDDIPELVDHIIKRQLPSKTTQGKVLVTLPSKMDLILEEVSQERWNQDAVWGEQNHHPFKWLAILGEEVGEANKAVLEDDMNNYREELIQVAAVAIVMVEAFDRTKT